METILFIYVLFGYFMLWLGLRKIPRRLGYIELFLSFTIYPFIWPIAVLVAILCEVKKRRDNRELLKYLSRKYNGKDY